MTQMKKDFDDAFDEDRRYLPVSRFEPNWFKQAVHLVMIS